MSKKGYKTIVILPYLPLKGELVFDDLRIWPFQKFKDTNIPDTALKDHINKILGTYTHINGRVVDNPTVITNSKYQFPNIYRNTTDKIEYLKQALLIPSILKMNSWSFITSDNFLSFYQRFQVGNDGIATQAGAIHGISTGGYKIGEIQFQKPSYINLPNQPIDINLPVLKALLDIYRERQMDVNKANIVNSLSPFFNSYKNSHDFSKTSRILNLIMSFELLFGETGRDKFRKNILRYTCRDPHTESRMPYPIIDARPGKTSGILNLTLVEIWAEEFYKLRHKLIHGNVVSNNDFMFKDLKGYAKRHDPHFYIAVNIFTVCVLRKLIELGYKGIPNYFVTSHSTAFSKNISGINDELFKIEDRSLHDMLSAI